VQTIIHSKTNGPNIYIHCSFGMFRFNPKMFLINSAYNSQQNNTFFSVNHHKVSVMLLLLKLLSIPQF